MSTTTPGRTSTTTMRPAPARTGAGPVPVLAVLLALLLLALAVVLVRDALVALGTLGGSPWLPAAVEALVGVTPSAVVVVVGVVVALVGLWLLLQGFHRRTRTEVSVRSQTGVFTGTGDVAHLIRTFNGMLDRLEAERGARPARWPRRRGSGSGSPASCTMRSDRA